MGLYSCDDDDEGNIYDDGDYNDEDNDEDDDDGDDDDDNEGYVDDGEQDDEYDDEDEDEDDDDGERGGTFFTLPFERTFNTGSNFRRGEVEFQVCYGAFIPIGATKVVTRFLLPPEQRRSGIILRDSTVKPSSMDLPRTE